MGARVLGRLFTCHGRAIEPSELSTTVYPALPAVSMSETTSHDLGIVDHVAGIFVTMKRNTESPCPRLVLGAETATRLRGKA